MSQCSTSAVFCYCNQTRRLKDSAQIMTICHASKLQREFEPVYQIWHYTLLGKFAYVSARAVTLMLWAYNYILFFHLLGQPDWLIHFSCFGLQILLGFLVGFLLVGFLTLYRSPSFECSSKYGTATLCKFCPSKEVPAWSHHVKWFPFAMRHFVVGKA